MKLKKHQKLAITVELILLPSLPIMIWLWMLQQTFLVGMIAAGAIVFGMVGLWAMEKVKKEETNEMKCTCGHAYEYYEKFVSSGGTAAICSKCGKKHIFTNAEEIE
jgi:hypothetical protein